MIKAKVIRSECFKAGELTCLVSELENGEGVLWTTFYHGAVDGGRCESWDDAVQICGKFAASVGLAPQGGVLGLWG